MAKLRTKQFVTVRRRRVVRTAKITRVLPTTVANISSINMATTRAFGQAIPTRYESIDGANVVVDVIIIADDEAKTEATAGSVMMEVVVALVEMTGVATVDDDHVKFPNKAIGVTATTASRECVKLLLTFSNVVKLSITSATNDDDEATIAAAAAEDDCDSDVEVGENNAEDMEL